MTQTFFSVDVETSSTNPFTGELLTIAIIPVQKKDTWEIGQGKHWALEYDYERSQLDAQTLDFWSKQGKEANDAAWNGDRLDIDTVAAQINGFVCSFSAEIHDRVFCANPASFDWAWTEKLFHMSRYPNPFSHRTLCMRNVLYGLQGGVWGSSRYKQVLVNFPEIHHHAYYDALSQAKDLVSIMSMVEEREEAAETYVPAEKDVIQYDEGKFNESPKGYVSYNEGSLRRNDAESIMEKFYEDLQGE